LVVCDLLGGEHWLWLLPPIALLSIVGPVTDITGRMTGLHEDPAVRTRLMALYVGLMFLGGCHRVVDGIVSIHLRTCF
jgi:hypothetical protein